MLQQHPVYFGSFQKPHIQALVCAVLLEQLLCPLFHLALETPLKKKKIHLKCVVI